MVRLDVPHLRRLSLTKRRSLLVKAPGNLPLGMHGLSKADIIGNVSCCETSEDETVPTSPSTEEENCHALIEDPSSILPLDDPYVMVRGNPSLNVYESGVCLEENVETSDVNAAENNIEIRVDDIENVAKYFDNLNFLLDTTDPLVPMWLEAF